MMLQVEESRFLQLAQSEKELYRMFENIVIQYCKEWVALNPEKNFDYTTDKTEVADYINKRIQDANLVLKGEVARVWFNSQGRGSLLYWSTNDSEVIHEVTQILEWKTYDQMEKTNKEQ